MEELEGLYNQTDDSPGSLINLMNSASLDGPDETPDFIINQLEKLFLNFNFKQQLLNWIDVDVFNNDSLLKYIQDLLDDSSQDVIIIQGNDGLKIVMSSVLKLDANFVQFKIIILELINQICLLSQINTIIINNYDILPILIDQLIIEVNSSKLPSDLLPKCSANSLIATLRNLTINLLQFGCDSKHLLQLYINSIKNSEEENKFFINFLLDTFQKNPVFNNYFILKQNQLFFENLPISSVSTTIQTWIQVGESDYDSVLLTLKNKGQVLSLLIRNSRLILRINGSEHSFNFIFDPLRFMHIVVLFNNNNLMLFIDGDFVERVNLSSFKFVQCDLQIGDCTNNGEISIKNILILNKIQTVEWINLSFNLTCNYENNYQNNLLSYLNYRNLNNFELKLEELNHIGKISNINTKNFHVDHESILLNITNTTLRNSNKNIIFHNSNSLYKLFHSIGGIPIILRLVESAQSLDLLILSIKLLFRLLDDWRNIKEIESINGYDILSSILKTKRRLINNEILDLILEFVGYDFNNPIDSIIINPMAYRSLIVDFDLWKKSDSDTFKFLLFQFTIFGQDSRFNNFSIKKLIKMRIIKRFIQALKYGSFEMKVLPVVFNSLLILVKANPSIEVMRSLSLYVVYALNNGDSSNTGPLNRTKSTSSLATIGSPSDAAQNNESLQRNCAICVLEVLSSMICDSSSSILLRKISKSITIRWILLILNDQSPVVAKLGLKLLVRMFSILGASSYSTFFNSNGLEMLTYLLKKWWDNDEIIVLIYSAGFGISQSQNLGSDISLLAKRLSKRETKLNVLMPEFMLLLNKVIEYSLIFIRENGNTKNLELVLNCIHLINGFVLAVEIGFEEIGALQDLYSSQKWLEGIFKINSRLVLLSQDNPDIKNSSNNFRRMLSSIFISKLSNKDFFTLYIPIAEFSNKTLTSTVYTKVFAHVNEFLSVSDFTYDNKDFFINVSKLLLQYSDFLKHYSSNNTDLNIVMQCTASVIEMAEKKTNMKSYIKSLKKSLGSLLLLKLFYLVDEKDPVSYEDFIKCLLFRQTIIFQMGCLDNKNLSILITFILKRVFDISDGQSMSINCLRTIYLHRQADFSEITCFISPKRSSAINSMFSSIISSGDDEAVKLMMDDGELSDIVSLSYDSSFKKLKLEFDLPNFISELSRVMKKEIIYTDSVISLFKRDRFALKNLIISGELSKYNRHIQDHSDNAQFYITIYNKIKTETSRLLFQDNGSKRYIVDYIEGVDRMRKRIIPEIYLSESEKLTYNIDVPMKELHTDRNSVGLINKIDTMTTSSANSFTELENSFEMVEDPQSGENASEDKNRKVLRSLNVGDRITDLWNISQINGLAAVESLMILGLTHLYLIENYFHCSNGEVVDIGDAPSNLRDPYLQLITGKFPNDSNSGTVKSHRAKNWDLNKLTSISKRQFLLRDVALEMFFIDGASILITCLSSKERDSIYSRLSGITSGKGIDNDLSQAFKLSTTSSASSGAGSFTFKLASAFSSTNTTLPVTAKWRTGKISNFYYLMLINTLAGRTFNDLTQYPVFPWVIADYTSKELDLSDPKSYRDLSKPMGAQSEARAEQFRERYDALDSLQDESAPPFHYGTHYSSAMVTTSFLIRLEPYVQSYLLLQGGKFDHADRLFYSIAKAWNSASKDNTTDVRELIPEFYFLPEFLTNTNNFQFGTLQDGSPINDVQLPPWANNDPKVFIQKNREALESPFVSANLNKWIDLVFGFKQNGTAAIDSLNVFHHLSYNGAINLDNIDDEVERRAMTGIINNFGQTPMQLFTRAHPAREVLNPISLYQDVDNFEARPTLLFESKLGLPINKLEIGNKSKNWEGRPGIMTTEDGLVIKSGNTLGSLIINKNVFESMHDSEIIALSKIGNKSFITGSSDGTLNVWKYPSKSAFKSLAILGSQTNYKNGSMLNEIELESQAILRGHTSSIKSIEVNKSFNMGLTIDEDGVVFIWDLARFNFIRQLSLKGQLAAMSEDSGDIAVISEDNMVSIFTINGELIISKKIEMGTGNKDNRNLAISSLTFGSINKSTLESNTSKNHEYWNNRVIAFGAKNMILLYELVINKHGNWELNKIKQLQNTNENEITSIKVQLISEPSSGGKILRGEVEIIFGDSRGKVYIWK